MKKKEIEKISWLSKKTKHADKFNVEANVFNLGNEKTLVIDICNDSPIARIVLCNNQFATYAPKEYKNNYYASRSIKSGWSAKRFEFILGDYYSAFRISSSYKDGIRSYTNVEISEVSQKIIKDFCNNGYDWYRSIVEFEDKIANEKRLKAINRKNKREKEYTDYWTSNLPKVPDEVIEWGIEKVIKHFIRIEPFVDDEAICHCSSCKRTFTIKRRMKVDECPLCHVKATSKRSRYPLGRSLGCSYRGYIKDNSCDESKEIIYLALVDDKFVQYHIQVERSLEDDEEDYTGYVLGCHILKDDTIHTFYRKYSSLSREEFWDMHNFPYPYSITLSKGEVYPFFDLLKNTEYKYSALELVGEVDPINYLKRYIAMPVIEKLAKVGLVTLAKTITSSNCDEKDKLWDCLRINKEEYNRLVKKDATLLDLHWMQHENATAKRIDDEDMSWFSANNVYPSELSFIEDKMSAKKIHNYLEKQKEITNLPIYNLIIKWRDYIDMCRIAKKDISAELVYKPSNIVTAHDDLANAKALDDREAEILAKFPGVNDICKSLGEKYNFSDENYSIICPESIRDIIREGKILGHCLDRTDLYFDRIEKNESYIMFLRKNIDKDMPFYSLEVEPGGTTRQKRTLGDKQDESYDDCVKFIKKWQEHLKKKLSEEDKQMAIEAAKLRQEEFTTLRENKSTIRHGLLAGQLLADVLEQDLMLA